MTAKPKKVVRIVIAQETYEALKDVALGFESPHQVIRRLLNLDSTRRGPKEKSKSDEKRSPGQPDEEKQP
jgi:hypothetical protein